MKRERAQVRASRAGMTLIELMIGMVVLVLLIGAMGIVVKSGQGAYAQDVVNSHVDALSRRAIDHVADELIDADRSSVDISFAADSVEYRRGQGWGGDLITSPTRRIELQLMPGELDDGIDNDGNGLVDECRVVFTPDVDSAPGVSVTRANYVRELLEGELPNGLDDNGNGAVDEGGLYLTYEPSSGVFTAQLTLERMGADGRLVTRTLQTAVRLRND